MTPARSRQRYVADGMTSTSSLGLQITFNVTIKNIKRTGKGVPVTRQLPIQDHAL